MGNFILASEDTTIYAKIDITNEEDYLIRDRLDFLEQQVMLASAEEDPLPRLAKILHDFESLYDSTQQTSPRALYGKARVLDLIANEQKSNSVLEKSIQAFVDLMSLGPSVPAELFKKAGRKCSSLMEFRGWTAKAIQVHKVLGDKFPESPEFYNKLGLLYLTNGNIGAAQETFKSVLRRFSGNKFASAHLGFILTSAGAKNDLPEGVELLKAGLEGKEKELRDGRFFLRLGDGLRRLGRSQEADVVFQDGAELGLYPSFWQRSLFNVEGLRAQPLWTLTETGLERELKRFVDQWREIRDEALAVLRDDIQTGLMFF